MSLAVLVALLLPHAATAQPPSDNEPSNPFETAEQRAERMMREIEDI